MERSVVNRRFRCYAKGNLAETAETAKKEDWYKTSFSNQMSPPMPDQGPTSNRPDPGSTRLEREESQLWRWALGLLVLFAAAVAALSGGHMKALTHQLLG